MKKWYVLYCRQGYRYQDRLSLHMETCDPVYVDVISTGKSLRVSSKKLCPGYLFINADLTSVSPDFILSVPGVIAFLKFDHTFYEVPDSVMESIQGLSVKTGDPALKEEIAKIAAAKTREEKEMVFLNFLRKYHTGGTIDSKNRKYQVSLSQNYYYQPE